MHSINKTARSTGWLYLIMLVAALFGLMYVPVQIIVPNDAAATAANINASEFIFWLGIVGHLIVLFTDLSVSVLLYVLLKPVNKTLTLVATVLQSFFFPMSKPWLPGLWDCRISLESWHSFSGFWSKESMLRNGRSGLWSQLDFLSQSGIYQFKVL